MSKITEVLNFPLNNTKKNKEESCRIWDNRNKLILSYAPNNSYEEDARITTIIVEILNNYAEKEKGNEQNH